MPFEEYVYKDLKQLKSLWAVTVLENRGKSWNWQKKIPGPGKSLNLGCGP